MMRLAAIFTRQRTTVMDKRLSENLQIQLWNHNLNNSTVNCSKIFRLKDQQQRRQALERFLG
jgi:hypothetical protein